MQDANQQLLDYFGKTVDELKDWTLIGVVHPDDIERVVARYRYSALSGLPYDVEHRCRRYDDEFRWFHVRAPPLKNAEGHVQLLFSLLGSGG